MQHQSINNYFQNYLSDIYGLTPKAPIRPEGLLLFPMPGNVADEADANSITPDLFKQGTRAFIFARDREMGIERAKATSWGRLFPRFEEIKEGDPEEVPSDLANSVKEGLEVTYRKK